MMASLTMQLAEQLAFHIERGFINPLLDFEGSSIPQYDPDQPHSLEALFEALIRLWPAKGITLFCIVDGLSHYPTRNHEDVLALTEALKFMSDLCLSGKGGDNFKLLMTAPSGFRDMPGWRALLKPELEMPGDLLGNQWKVEIGDQITRLYGPPTDE